MTNPLNFGDETFYYCKFTRQRMWLIIMVLLLHGDNWWLICLSVGVEMGEACTIVLRGATKQILDEAERSLHDALCVLTQTVKETKTVFGGGM